MANAASRNYQKGQERLVMRKIFVGFVFLVLLVWIFFPRTKHPYGRETYVVVSDPMIVLSWSPAEKELTRIFIPSDIAADGTHGYGTYTLAAFWRLGEIDKKDGTVLSETFSEALGIPIDGYIGAKNGTVLSPFIFSLKNILGAYRTNIPLLTFIQLAWQLDVERPNHVNTYDFSNNPPAISQLTQLPDGSAQQILDPQRVDAQLAHVFEDDAARKEPVTAAVYNTTDMPSLGNRVGRLFTNLGVSVVTVGNDTPEIKTCTLTGSLQALKSKSAAIIMSVLGCTSTIGKTSRANLILRVGSSYAKRFLPN